MLKPFSEDDLADVQEQVAMLAAAFNLRDYAITVGIADDDDEESHTYAMVQFSDFWSAEITLHSKFFDCDRREQVLTLIHELMHVMHKGVDVFVGDLIADNEELQRLYESVQEEYVERLEIGFGNLLHDV